MPSAFPEPRVIRWKSFDGREITGLYYHPPSRFEGVRPVVVNVHGGPEAQARAGFIGRNNYFVNELGVALIYPNVRGSSGFGKTFLKLDNGRLREDSVKDLGALLDWIGAQPGLDANRVLVMGGSYGGYMTLAAAVHYADRIAGLRELRGHLQLRHLPRAHRDLPARPAARRVRRRARPGDARVPRIDLAAHARVDRSPSRSSSCRARTTRACPGREAEQIVATLKKNGTPAWYLLANDEGHGFRKKANADFQFYATVEFIRRTLKP